MSDYYDLGNFQRTITTSSPEAQMWFDRGFNWTYGFHHEEAIECFAKALTYDPQCVMALWGIAYASGPNYNKQWGDLEEDEKTFCINAAGKLTDLRKSECYQASKPEYALVEALIQRYSNDPTEDNFKSSNDAYANAMRKVYESYPDDIDVCALFAESLMNRTPWELWDLHSGTAAEGADTKEAVTVLETAFEQLSTKGSTSHPGLLHMYLHLMEMSPHPEKALVGCAGSSVTNFSQPQSSEQGEETQA